MLVELDEQERGLVVRCHCFGLVVEAAVAEGGDEVADGLALDADVWGEDVVADCYLAGDDDYVVAVEEGGEGAAEFAHIDYHARRGGCCC